MGITDCLGGSASNSPPVADEQGYTVKTAPVDVRLGFLRKVYFLLTINFSITVAVSCAFAFIEPVKEFVVARSWLIWVGFALTLVSLVFLTCLRPKFPFDLVAMYAFVLSMSLMVGIIVAFYYERSAGIIVLQAFITTAAIFLTITAYVSITKADFSFLYGFLAAASLAFCIIALFTFAFSWVRGSINRVWSFAISVFGALLMVGYILYDTSMVITKFGPDDWLTAVVTLYMDVVNLFLFLLNIFSFVSE